MANYAQLDENNVVTNVIVIKESDCQDSEGNHSETVGIAFCQSLCGQDTSWIELGSEGAIGFTYDSVNDRFIEPQPYPSWTLNQSTGFWEAPVAMPESDGTNYFDWNEDTQSWDEFDIPE